jgi:7,8-dihydroneopterin aldolase/epimerase/oxygenase
MLTVSVHGIKIHAPIGLYPDEKVIGNNFETDVDIWLPDTRPWPFADYTLVQKIVAAAFEEKVELLEELVWNIHSSIKEQVPVAEKIKVTVRKLKPPMPGDVAYSQVCYEA